MLVAGEASVDVARAVALLRERGMHRILCEGGPTLLSDWSRRCRHRDLRDAGPQTRREPTRGPPGCAVAVALPISMRLEHALVYDDYLFLKYRR